ncbi:hypothetical protein OGAPHI_003901 [Ogataea philodendri]|uniref:Origin recognition complex subunit 1 n=1 Tax=Ogataea philodendri TaxID=1378263 RepID=A0A9P8P574_9ASCO|nr:uncharacterized protein OGAPHI_003901 [Ogataea philodendri]KAH3665713.1 hypothetical protein OGAPHI_003901 [Ogataea philodendri]
MATTQKALGDWKLTLLEPDPATPSKRRSRRTTDNTAQRILLKRDLDGLELNPGDTVLVASDEGEPDIALIRDIQFGTDHFLDVRVLWFARLTDIEAVDLPKDEFHPNDVFLTPISDKVMLNDIIEKCVVLSTESFARIKLDISNSHTTFRCSRFTDRESVFTGKLDWADYSAKNPESLYQEVKDLTSPVQSESPRKRQRASPQKPVQSVYVDDSQSDIEMLDSDSAYESPSEEKPKKPPTTPRKSKQKRTKAQSPSKSATPRKSPRKPRDSVPVLPTLIRQKFFEDDNELVIDDADLQEVVDSNGKVVKTFRKAKERLLPSAKLQTLPCRDNEFDQLYNGLADSILTHKGRCIYVSGTPGVGKTATIREVIKQLFVNLTNDNDKKMFNYLEINGLKLMSAPAAYEQLYHKISGVHAKPGAALDLLETHFETKDPKRLPLVVLLDEMDQVVTKNQTVMYNFFNWPSYENSKLIVVAVANTMDLPERLLTNKISSRLGLTRIQFPGYTFAQLSEIIKHRLEKIERANDSKLVISKDAIEFASRKVASVSGDARRSLVICVRALEIAEMEFLSKPQSERDQLQGRYNVGIMHVMRAVNETTSTPVANYLNSLSFLAKMVLVAFLLRRKRTGSAELALGEVIDELNNQFGVVLFSELKRQLNEEQLELVQVLYGDGSARLRVNGFGYIVRELDESGIIAQQQLRAERLRLVRLNVNEDEVLGCLKRDSLMSELMVAM